MEAAAGTYARIIFSDAVSEREQHLPDLQKAMLDATPDCIKVLSLSGNLITMNKAGCIALGVPEHTEFGMSWPSLLPEESRERSLEALRQAASGCSARFAGQSQSPGGTRYWDNLLNPVIDASGSVVSILCVSRDVTEKALLEQDLKDAIEREKLLSREMQHRIKNLFCVVSGIISISEKEAARGKRAGSGNENSSREDLRAVPGLGCRLFAAGQ
jgi:PAS domain S-box-containing protein